MKGKTGSGLGRYAVVVTGTPGTGKTTISKQLADQIGATYLPLTQLVIDKRLHEAIDRRRRTRIVNLRRTRAFLAKSLSTERKLLVIDSHIPDAIPREYVRNILVLRCHPRILEARLRRKGWGPQKIRENVLAEILDSCYVVATSYYGPRRIAQLETSGSSVRKCLARAKRIVMKKPYGTVRVDWISVLSREHSLVRYFR